MALCAGLQRSPTIQDTLVQAYLFSVKPGCYRVTPYAHCPYRAASAGKSGRFFVMEDLLGKE